MVELAWLRLQNQPASALSLWFHERVRLGRMRKTTIIALARMLLIALWGTQPPACRYRPPGSGKDGLRSSPDGSGSSLA
jgi:hypothetical protein